MSDPIFELLAPYFDSLDPDSRPNPYDDTTAAYLNRLTTLSVADLTSTEPASLAQASQSNLRSLQALSKRSHISITASASDLSKLSNTLPTLHTVSKELKSSFPPLESKATVFAEKYRKSSESLNPILEQRRDTLLLSRNVDRISSILDLPTLLSSAISSGQPGAGSTSGTSSVNYASALDLHVHIKRLATLYPESPLVSSISAQSEREMKLLTTNLITSLRGQGIKLAGAMRTIGWLRRVAPELDEHFAQHRTQSGRLGSIGTSYGSGDGALGALLLVCRLASLETMLNALSPLRDLADQETAQRIEAAEKPARSKPKTQRRDSNVDRGDGGQQTERYLKRYIEIFREQSFAIVSMYKSIFPSALPVPEATSDGTSGASKSKPAPKTAEDSLLPLPSPLATFTPHLVDTLFDTLQSYLPNVQDKSARDSLMTQVLYCAGSLGRLGGDFSLMLALLEEDMAAELKADEAASDPGEALDGDVATPAAVEPEWVEVMKKHRTQASRLELLASGVGVGEKKGSREVTAGPIPA